MNTTILRLRYTQFLVIFLLGIFIYIMSQSLSGGTLEFEENFWNRQFLITSLNKLKLELGDRVLLSVILGKEGWLEFTANSNLDGYQNATEIGRSNLESTQQELQKLYEELQKRNITLLLVIPPNKATIYADKLPDQIQKLKQRSNLDEFADYIKQHGPSVFLDLRPALQDARKTQNAYDVFYKTDSHWSNYGAFIAYREIMKELAKSYPQLAPKNIKDFKVTTNQRHRSDLANMISATNLFEPEIKFNPKQADDVHWNILNDDIIVSLRISTTSKKDLPTLLMYEDSFGYKLNDFIAPHFSKVTYVYNHSKYQDLISLQGIDAINPNIVIVELVERGFNIEYLKNFLRQMFSNQR